MRALAQRGPETKLLAGGTDLLPQLKNGLLKPARVIDLSGVARLRAVESANGQGLRIGSAVTARALELDRTVRSRYLSLAESGALVGSVQVRNLATLGGNLCNAAPSADMAPPLLALDAEAIILGPKGERRVPIATFFTGVRQTVLAPDELLVELAVPAPGPTAAAPTCDTPRGGSSTSPWSGWRHSSRWPTACAPRRGSRWPPWRRCRSARRRPSARSRGRP